MKKIIALCVLSIVFSSFGLNKIVIPQRASAGSVITASKTNENLDTIANKFNKLIDSTAKFVRYEAISSGDSTLVADTAYMRTFTAGTAGITAANIDTSHTRHATADSATIPIFKGNETHRGTIDVDSISDLLKIGDSLYIGIPNATSGTAKKSLTFQPGGFANPGAYTIGSNGDKIVLYSSASATYDGRIGIGSAGNLWIKSASPGGTGSVEVYVDSACAVPKFRVTKDSVKCNETLFADSGIVTTTLNTGNGDNELYPMDQDVKTTASPTFVNVTSNLTGNVTGNVSGSSGSCTGNAATATNGVVTTGSYADPAWITSLNGFKVCDTGSFACTLKTSDVTVQQIGTAYYSKSGNVVTITFPELLGTSNSTGLLIYAKIPYQPRYSSSGVYMFAGGMAIVDNSVGSVQRYAYTYEGGITPNCFAFSSVFTSSGTKGIYPTSITYMKAD